MRNIGSITLTSGKTFETYQTEMEKNKCYFGNGLARTLMENSGFVTKGVTMDLVAYRLSELGFTEAVNTTEIGKKAESLGLKRCLEGIVFETVFTLLSKVTELFPEDQVQIWTDTGLWIIGLEKEQVKYSSCIFKLSSHPAISFYPDLVVIFAK